MLKEIQQQAMFSPLHEHVGRHVMLRPLMRPEMSFVSGRPKVTRHHHEALYALHRLPPALFCSFLYPTLSLSLSIML